LASVDTSNCASNPAHKDKQNMTTTVNDTEQRITELETRLEFQDETITELNDEMVLLQKRLYRQEKSLQMLTEKLQSQGQEDEGAEPQIEPPPPHY